MSVVDQEYIRPRSIRIFDINLCWGQNINKKNKRFKFWQNQISSDAYYDDEYSKQVILFFGYNGEDPYIFRAGNTAMEFRISLNCFNRLYEVDAFE